MSLKDDANSQLSRSLVLSSSAIVLRNVVGKVSEGMCLMENWLLIRFELGPLVWNPAVITTDWDSVEWESH